MLSFRSRGTSRLKKAGPGTDDANGDVRRSIDNASTIGSVRTRDRRSMSLKERFGFRASPKIKGPESGRGSANGMGSVGCGKSGNDNGDSARRELLVKHSEDFQGNNDATIKSAGVRGNTALKHSEGVGVNKTTTVKHPEDGDNVEDANDKGESDRADKRQGSGWDPDRVAADPCGTSREASAEYKIAAVGPSTSAGQLELAGTVIGFNIPPYPPRGATNSPFQRFPSRSPGPGQPVSAQLRRLPPRAPTPTVRPAFRASTAGGACPPSSLRPYSAASTASSSATMTPEMYSRRNFPVENRQRQYPPSRFHHLRQQSPPQQCTYYQPPQRPIPIRSGGSFPLSHSSSSSAKTGNSSSSPTTQSLESIESPPPLEPKAPSTKSSSEEFITPSQTPNLEKARASPGPCHSQDRGPPNSQPSVERPQYPTYPYPLQKRTILRPLRSAPFFHEGMYFAQISYNTTPEEAMAGPKLSGVRYPPFHLTHLGCMTQHRVMHKVHNLHHSVPCMTCRTMGHCGTIGATDKGDDPAEYRFVCGWCAIRICAGCRDELRFQDNRLMDLLRVIRARGGGDGLGDLNSPSELNIKIQPRVPKMGDTQLPADLSAPTLAIGAEELENLSHFGPPNFSGGSTMISRPKTGSPGSETGRPRRRLTEFEEYDGEPCWPPPTRGKRDPTLSQRAELANIEEYPRQIPSSHPPIGSSGVNSQRRPYQRLPGPPQWNQRGPTPQPRDPLIPRGRSPKADSPEPGRESDRESEAPVEPNDGKQTHQHVQLSHQGSPPRQPSPLVQVSPPQEPLSPLQPSPPEHEAIPSSALKVVGQQEVTLTPPPKSPRRKGSPAISIVDVPGMPRQAGVGQPEVILAHIEKTEIKLPRAKQQPTPELGRPQVEKKQETRAKPPLPSPMPQQERTPGLDKPSRSTPSPRPEPAQVTKMGERLEESVFMGNGMPQPVEKAPGSEVVKLEPVPIPMPKPAEPIPAAKQEKSVQSLTKQEKALPEPPKLVSNMIGDPTISKPVTPPKRPVYPTKPEPNIDLSHFNLKPTTTQERYKLPDSMQLPEIDFGGALDTMAITDGLLGRPARAHQKPPAAPIRLEGEEKEGSISGSMKDKKKWRLPGFGKKKVEKK